MTRAYYHKVAIVSGHESVDLLRERLPDDLKLKYVEESFLPQDVSDESLQREAYVNPDDKSVVMAFFFDNIDDALMTAERLENAGLGPVSVSKVEMDQFPRGVDVGEKYRMIFLNDRDADKGGRIPLYISGSQIFGTGEHPTTRLMAESLEETDVKKKRVIDAGAGSCILTLIALKEGCSEADAFDLQEGFSAISAEVAKANMVAFRAFETGQEGYVRLRKEYVRTADLLLVNMLPVNGDPVAKTLVPLLKQGAMVMVSGVPAGKREESLAFYRGLGLDIIREKKTAEWVFFTGVKL